MGLECPSCKKDIDLELTDLEDGEVITCPECGEQFEIEGQELKPYKYEGSTAAEEDEEDEPEEDE